MSARSGQRQTIVMNAGNRERVLGFLAGLASNKAWLIQISPWRRLRNSQQNRYLWGVCYPAILARLPGWEPEDVHQYFLGEHYGWQPLEFMGQPTGQQSPLKGSSGMTTAEFADHVAYIQRKAAEAGIYIPDPNEGRP